MPVVFFNSMWLSYLLATVRSKPRATLFCNNGVIVDGGQGVCPSTSVPSCLPQQWMPPSHLCGALSSSPVVTHGGCSGQSHILQYQGVPCRHRGRGLCNSCRYTRGALDPPDPRATSALCRVSHRRQVGGSRPFLYMYICERVSVQHVLEYIYVLYLRYLCTGPKIFLCTASS